MNDLLFPIAGGLLGYALCVLWQRHGWQLRSAIRQNWPTRCAQCGQWFRYRNTQPAKRTTGHYVNLCDACWIDAFTPRAK